MGAAISKVSKAAETGLKSASKKASKSLRHSKYVSSDILPTRSKSETTASQRQDKLSRHMLSKQAVGDALRGHAMEEAEGKLVQAAKESAASRPAAGGSPAANEHTHSQKRQSRTPGPRASQHAENMFPGARQNVDAGPIRGRSARRQQSAHAAESALPGQLNSMGSSGALLGLGPSTSSFPLLPGASSVAAHYDSLYGGDWRLSTAPDVSPGCHDGEA